MTPYLRERLPAWNAGKRNDFVPKLTTRSGRHLAAARLARLDASLQEVSAELEDYVCAVRQGRLAVVRWFMEHRDNPRLPEQLRELEQRVLPAWGVGPQAYAFVAALRQETVGSRYWLRRAGDAARRRPRSWRRFGRRCWGCDRRQRASTGRPPPLANSACSGQAGR